MERKGSMGSALAVWLLLVLAGAAWGGARVTEWSATATAASDDGEDGDHPGRGRGGGDGGGRGSGKGTGGSTDGGNTDGSAGGSTDSSTDGTEPGPTSIGEQHRFVLAMGEVDPIVRGGAPDEDVPGPNTEHRTDRFEYLAFYPERLTVHAGDVIELRRPGFHSLMFVDDHADNPGWLRRDELEGTSSFANRHPTDASCAFETDESFVAPDGLDPCVLSGDPSGWTTGVQGSVVEIQLEPGTYPFVCTIHVGMAGELEVVADDVPVWTPEEVDAQRAEAYAADTAAGEQLIEDGKRPSVEAVGDTRVWTVKAGGFTDDGRVGVVRFLPSNLTIAEGDEVRWVVPDGPRLDMHTVSFPNDAYPFGFLTYLNPSCDPDEEDGGAPGVPLQYPSLALAVAVGTMPCPPGTVLDFQFHQWAWRAPLRAPGDLVATPGTVHDSGFLLSSTVECPPGRPYGCDPWTGEHFPEESYARFGGPGVYAFTCNVHPEYGMRGAIRVIGGVA